MSLLCVLMKSLNVFRETVLPCSSLYLLSGDGDAGLLLPLLLLGGGEWD